MSSNGNIGGPLTVSTLAKLHMPTGRELDAEIVRLRATGLLPRDIAELLHITVAAISVALTRSIT